MIGILLLTCSVATSADGYLLFTANINGNLENCDCGPNITRGIGRIKTFFTDFCRIYPHTIIIDGGDFFNSYPQITLNTTMLQALHYLDYHILVPGDQEFVEGMVFFQHFQSQMKEKLLASNMNLPVKPYFSFNLNKINIFFYSFLSPKAFDFIERPEKIDCNPFSLVKKRGEKKGLQVLIFHGTMNEAKDILQNNGWIDLLLLAHSQYVGSLPMKNQIIIGGGSDSEGVTIIQIREKGKITSEKNSLNSQNKDYQELETKYQINWSEEYQQDHYLFLTGYARMNNLVPEDGNIMKLIESYHHSMKNIKTRN
jgi:hypothetical protein